MVIFDLFIFSLYNKSNVASTLKSQTHLIGGTCFRVKVSLESLI